MTEETDFLVDEACIGGFVGRAFQLFALLDVLFGGCINDVGIGEAELVTEDIDLVEEHNRAGNDITLEGKVLGLKL